MGPILPLTGASAAESESFERPVLAQVVQPLSATGDVGPGAGAIEDEVAGEGAGALDDDDVMGDGAAAALVDEDDDGAAVADDDDDDDKDGLLDEAATEVATPTLIDDGVGLAASDPLARSRHLTARRLTTAGPASSSSTATRRSKAKI